MQNVKLRLDAWRDAERRRDGLPLDSPEWQEAEEDTRRACKVFHAEVAQVSARYAEADFQGRDAWSLHLDLGTSPVCRPVADASPARVAAAVRSVKQVHAGALQTLHGRRS